jgi:hypothetical protein
MKKQTAVEWLLDQLDERKLITLDKHSTIIFHKDFSTPYDLIVHQAKAMEKEQIINTWSEATAPDHEIGLSDAFYIISQVQKAEQYYNETYEGDK